MSAKHRALAPARFARAALAFCGLALAGFALSASGGAIAGPLCRVADPTGSALNVRTAPNLRVIGALENGTRVEVLQSVRGDDGKSWAFVADAGDGRAHGWVFAAYLDCR